ncbi:hypothetical protein B0J11DRAFT_565321 [Dendryphion nanum]|uniref:Uncharacterized protein n=1 Tax=Dendryphion nanum TaxID=256645 RepID=A0A9P9EFB7_9PLEO|nr:hypothetical protein B0J11DRAFT_565321 [Dendryphion nanum]
MRPRYPFLDINCMGPFAFNINTVHFGLTTCFSDLINLKFFEPRRKPPKTSVPADKSLTGREIRSFGSKVAPISPAKMSFNHETQLVPFQAQAGPQSQAFQNQAQHQTFQPQAQHQAFQPQAQPQAFQPQAFQPQAFQSQAQNPSYQNPSYQNPSYQNPSYQNPSYQNLPLQDQAQPPKCAKDHSIWTKTRKDSYSLHLGNYKNIQVIIRGNPEHNQWLVYIPHLGNNAEGYYGLQIARGQADDEDNIRSFKTGNIICKKPDVIGYYQEGCHANLDLVVKYFFGKVPAETTRKALSHFFASHEVSPVLLRSS